MSKEELIRQIRKMISAEYGAIADYTRLAEECEDALAKKVLIKIAEEDKIELLIFHNFTF